MLTWLSCNPMIALQCKGVSLIYICTTCAHTHLLFPKHVSDVVKIPIGSHFPYLLQVTVHMSTQFHLQVALMLGGLHS